MSETDSVVSRQSKHKEEKAKLLKQIADYEEVIAQKEEDIGKLKKQLAELEAKKPGLQCLRQNGDGNMVIILDISNDIPDEISFSKGIEMRRNDEKSFARLNRTKITPKGYPILLKKGNFPDSLNFEALASDICEANYAKKKYLKQKNRFYLADDIFDDFKGKLINAINSIPI